jgi:tripartite-type tricarboxylate transporter receptor subunit TctC
MRPASILTFLLASALAGFAPAHHASAQDSTGNYPNQTIRIVVPFSAGDATDITARIVAQKMMEDLKATIVIENKPGATGATAAEYVAKAWPDGYTLFMSTGSVNSVNLR